MATVQELEAKVSHYEKILKLAEHDLAHKGYVTFCKIIQQQVEFLDDFNIKSNIDGKKTETVMYERAESMWEKLPKNISALNALRVELKIEYDEEAGKPKTVAASPQSIANMV